ncbi:Hypothetical_protein [Hexamita inflata]|uniref:Hypothetical_protein n=1 Tax=Hexamita inflata TaxID=28002 RepID=A0AA86RD61_9EUKA|nr:Hypothetical protein HINF_LOCUS57924 [Hexamita inflata]
MRLQRRKGGKQYNQGKQCDIKDAKTQKDAKTHLNIYIYITKRCNYGKIFDYLHEKGMMKVATQSQIKEVPAKPKQTLKNFEKAHKTKTKKKSTQTAEKGNDKLEDTSTKKNLTILLRPKQSPT